MSSSESEECEIIITNFIPMPGPMGPTGDVNDRLGGIVNNEISNVMINHHFTTLNQPTLLKNDSFWFNLIGGRLLYTGTQFNFNIQAMINFSGTSNVIRCRMVKNDIDITGTRYFKTNDIHNINIVTISTIVTMVEGDYIELQMASEVEETITLYGFSISGL